MTHAEDSGELLAAARRAAEAAEAEIRRFWPTGAAVRTKADSTPVTDADVAAEKAIRDLLRERFPEHGFYGEETGRSGADSNVQWLVDPIDGTRAFVRGYPFFSTQIAAMVEGELRVGVSRAPFHGEAGQTAWAGAGTGAFIDGKAVGVSRVDSLGQAHVSFGNLRSLAAGSRWTALGGIVEDAARVRGYGDYLHYHLLAAGHIDAVIESDVNILDIAALAVIVREAGGVFTDLEGKPVGLETTGVLAANPALHAQLLERISLG